MQPLLAGDQIQWAQCYKTYGGKSNMNHLAENDKQMEIFKELTKMGLRPWTAMFNIGKSNQIKEAIVKLCQKHKIPEHKWLGKSQKREISVTTKQMDQVCGISVNFGWAPYIKSAGWFGATRSTYK